MKKFIIFLIITIIVVCSVGYIYIINKSNSRIANQENQLFEEYYQKKVYGAEVATIINKAMDNNDRNYIELDDKNEYIENNTNSIKINIKMIDNDTIYPMEKFAGGGIQNFVEYYNMIQFECVDIQYHPETKKVKSLLFEQITI